MAQKLMVQARQFVSLSERLHQKGMTKKEIAQHLGLYPSAYSSLSNIVFKRLLQSEEEDGEAVSRAFSAVNNVSEKRIRREIHGYLAKLERLDQFSPHNAPFSPPAFDTQKLEAQAQQKLTQLVGTYHCYYISTFGYQVKREPLLISQDTDGQFFVQKGNQQSPSIYKGGLFLANPHLLNLQLAEQETLNRDHFLIHLHFPPSYPSLMRILRGFSISMSNARFPISRRIILQKQSDQAEAKSFNALKTQFFSPESPQAQKGIVAYLYQSSSLMECMPIPRPRFDEQDLAKELEISDALSEYNF